MCDSESKDLHANVLIASHIVLYCQVNYNPRCFFSMSKSRPFVCCRCAKPPWHIPSNWGVYLSHHFSWVGCPPMALTCTTSLILYSLQEESVLGNGEASTLMDYTPIYPAAVLTTFQLIDRPGSSTGVRLWTLMHAGLPLQM